MCWETSFRIFNLLSTIFGTTTARGFQIWYLPLKHSTNQFALNIRKLWTRVTRFNPYGFLLRLNGNVRLRWFVSYRRHTVVRFETRPIRLELSALLFLLASRRISDTLVCDRFRFKMETFASCVFTIVCDKTNADSFRSSQTVADHINQVLVLRSPICQTQWNTSPWFYAKRNLTCRRDRISQLRSNSNNLNNEHCEPKARNSGLCNL